MYLKFNGTDLHNIFKVTRISKPLAPGKTTYTLDIQGLDGQVFNGSKLNSMEFEVELVINGSSEDDYKSLKRGLIDIVTIKNVVPIQFSPNKYGYGMCTSEVLVTDYNNYDGLATFTITCFDPLFRSVKENLFTSTGTNKLLDVRSDGTIPTKPFISVGFTKDAHFLQLENKRSGERMLLGKYPELNLSSKPAAKYVLKDDCKDLSTWTLSSAPLDEGRATGGTFAISTKNKGGFILGNFPSGSSDSKWKGGSYRRNLSKACEDFDATIDFSFMADGKNGDPNDKVYDDESVVGGAENVLIYYTTTTLNIRKGPGTNHQILGTLKEGYKIVKDYGIDNGWLAFKVRGISGIQDDTFGYISMKYVKTRHETVSITKKSANFRVVSNAPLRESPSREGKVLSYLNKGDVVRCIHNHEYYYFDGKGGKWTYYKLAAPFKGNMGYISKTNIAKASDVTVEVDTTTVSADDLTGICEIYGIGATGAHIFRALVQDDSPYYEANTLKFFVGSQEISTNAAVTPPPKYDMVNTAPAGSPPKYEQKPIRGGAWGEWNDLQGRWHIKRQKVKEGRHLYTMELLRIKDGVITKSAPYTWTSDVGTQLAAIIVYIGSNTTDKAKMSSICLENVEVKDLTQADDESDTNAIFFQKGDVVDIDFDNRDVYVNEINANEILNINSRFFDIVPGDTQVKFTSDDNNIVVAATLQDKWVGDE